MTVAIVFLMSWITLVIARNTPIGCILHRAMVEIPATAANRLTRGNLAIAIALLVLTILHLSAGDSDPVRMLGLFAPDLAIWLTSLEFSAIIEAAVGVAAVLTALRRTSSRYSPTSYITSFAKRPERRANRARRRQRDSCASPANDDDEGVFALAS